MPYDVYTIKSDGQISHERTEKAPSLDMLQKAVGGYIETVPYFTKFTHNQIAYKRGRAYCNENGISEQKPVNYKASMLWKNQYDYATTLLGNVIYYAKVKA